MRLWKRYRMWLGRPRLEMILDDLQALALAHEELRVITRLRCPTCQTTYLPERCGVDFTNHKRLTIVCGICHTPFDYTLTE